jgi:hypothetical protein
MAPAKKRKLEAEPSGQGTSPASKSRGSLLTAETIVMSAFALRRKLLGQTNTASRTDEPKGDSSGGQSRPVRPVVKPAEPSPRPTQANPELVEDCSSPEPAVPASDSQSLGYEGGPPSSGVSVADSPQSGYYLDEAEAGEWSSCAIFDLQTFQAELSAEEGWDCCLETTRRRGRHTRAPSSPSLLTEQAHRRARELWCSCG